MTAWLCPEVLLVLAGVGLILVDSLWPSKEKRFLGALALGLSLALWIGVILGLGRTMPASWSNLFVSDGLSALFKPFFILCQ